MSVAVDATGTLKDSASNATSFNYTGITVGSGGSNYALIFLVATSSAGASTTSAMTATWDSGGTNQAMTLIGNKSNNTSSSAFSNVWVFGLRNPTPGNKTLAVSWTTSANYSSIAISFTGVDQTSDATAFPNFNSGGGTGSTSISLAITSATGNIPVAILSSGTISSVGQTQLFLESVTPADAAAQRTAGAATATFTATVQTGTNNDTYVYAGCDVAASTGGGPTLITVPRKNIIYRRA